MGGGGLGDWANRMARRVHRAYDRGTGCHLSAEMVIALEHVMSDGEWWQDMHTEGEVRRERLRHTQRIEPNG